MPDLLDSVSNLSNRDPFGGDRGSTHGIFGVGREEPDLRRRSEF
jgi:hypothetical protein